MTDCFIGKSFMDEIDKSLFHNLPEPHTDVTDSTSVSKCFSSSFFEDDYGIRSRSQLNEEQHKDLEISPLLGKKMSMKQIWHRILSVFHITNWILMRKWRFPEVPADEGWAVNHQIVVPKIYRSEILSMAHETPTSGHLGINKTYHPILDLFYWPSLKADVSNYCRSCHTCQVVVGCSGCNGPLRHFFQSISDRLSERGRKRREKIEESKNVQTTTHPHLLQAQ